MHQFLEGSGTWQAVLSHLKQERLAAIERLIDAKTELDSVAIRAQIKLIDELMDLPSYLSGQV